VREFIGKLGDSVHVVAVCQPTVPVLASVSLMASDGLKLPATLTLMAGPVDARESPTDVCKYAVRKPISWFKRNLIHRVPSGFAGEGRGVYPGFLQLFSFVSMNPRKHLEAYLHNWYDVWKENTDSVAKHEDFYDEYNSVLDMDERFYLETVEEVFHKFSLAKGEMVLGGKRVIPGDIKDCKLLIIEGSQDDIAGVGQTFAAHKLCTGVIIKKYLLAEGVGHYGVFSGKKWREKIYPTLRGFIRG
jgi:poly(3-hydroxybutyrate) depolymerase